MADGGVASDAESETEGREVDEALAAEHESSNNPDAEKGEQQTWEERAQGASMDHHGAAGGHDSVAVVYGGAHVLSSATASDRLLALGKEATITACENGFFGARPEAVARARNGLGRDNRVLVAARGDLASCNSRAFL